MPPALPAFPLLCLIVSGGHSQLVLFKNHFDYKLLGQTGDDAVGEAFDKVAKILGLPYPGGPSVGQAALKGDSTSVKLPTAKLENKYDFSFSGLKTATLRAAQQLAGKDFTFPSTWLPAALTDGQKVDIAASFQHTAIQTLIDKLQLAIAEFQPKTVAIAGGVAASQYLRQQIETQIKQPVLYPDIKLCTDNAAMIAALGYQYAAAKMPPDDPYSLEIDTNLSM
jgi:N6-L-threonylcarbamoyladenine synthase